jgi:hypothetical protein
LSAASNRFNGFLIAAVQLKSGKPLKRFLGFTLLVAGLKARRE